MIYPALGGEEGIDDIIAEAKARQAAFDRDNAWCSPRPTATTIARA